MFRYFHSDLYYPSHDEEEIWFNMGQDIQENKLNNRVPKIQAINNPKISVTAIELRLWF